MDSTRDNMEIESQDDETWLERSLRQGKQILMVLAATSVNLTHGMSVAWPNAFASDLSFSNASFFGTGIECSEWQMDLAGSIYFLGSLPAFLLAGCLASSLGRRRSMAVASIPGLLGALVIALAVNTELVLLGRFLEGVRLGMTVVAVRSYVVEIADTDIRGIALTLVSIMMHIGSIFLLSLGMHLTWFELPFVTIGILSCYSFLVLSFLPESPTFLIIARRDEEAKVLLRRLRGPTINIPKMLQDLKDQNEAVATTSGWGVLLQKDILKRELIIFGCFLLTHFTGFEVIKANTVRILETSGFLWDRKLCAILVPSFFLVGNFLMLFLLDRIGRRRCLMLSLLILIATYAILGTYSLLNKGNESTYTGPEVVLLEQSKANVEYSGENTATGSPWTWTPLACLMLASVGQSVGTGPMPWILAPEYFPTTIRSQAVCICSLMGSLLSFVSLQLFSPLKSFLGDAGLYWSYSITALLGIPYTLLFVEETRRVSVG